MQANIVSYVGSDIAILISASSLILAKLIAWLWPQSKARRLGLDFGRQQPILAAVLALVSFALENNLGWPQVLPPGLATGWVNYLALIEWLRLALMVVVFYQEQRLISRFLLHEEVQRTRYGVILYRVRFNLALVIFSCLLPLWLPEFKGWPALEHASVILCQLLLIWSIVAFIINLTTALEANYLRRREVSQLTDFHTRSVATKTRIYKKIVNSLVVVIGAAASCLLFDSARAVGASILASAGIATGIIGLAANKIIANFFAGVQLALTQPIRINDAVTVEGEFGVVEDISLNYVVVKIWDLRRLVLPINYFLEKPFLNFSRNSTDVIAQIYFFCDYSVPIAEIRSAFNQMVADSRYWDQKTLNLQVCDLLEARIRFRGIAGAANPGDAWNLKCEVYEKLTQFLATHYPQSLPHVRLQVARGEPGTNSSVLV